MKSSLRDDQKDSVVALVIEGMAIGATIGVVAGLVIGSIVSWLIF